MGVSPRPSIILREVTGGGDGVAACGGERWSSGSVARWSGGVANEGDSGARSEQLTSAWILRVGAQPARTSHVATEYLSRLEHFAQLARVCLGVCSTGGGISGTRLNVIGAPVVARLCRRPSVS